MLAHGQNLRIQLTVYNSTSQLYDLDLHITSVLTRKEFPSWPVLFDYLDQEFRVTLSPTIREHISTNRGIGRLTFITNAWIAAESAMRPCKFVVQVQDS